MIVKKFQAPTETEAVMKAKEELGSSAVVLNVKTLKQRGIFRIFKKDVVEITAALEENDFVNGIKDRKPTVEKTITSQKELQRTNTVKKNSIDLVADEQINVSADTAAIEKKLDSLHSLLKNQITTKSSDETKAIKEMSATQEVKQNDEDGKKIVQQRENANVKFLKLIYKKLIDNEVDEKYADEIIGDI